MSRIFFQPKSNLSILLRTTGKLHLFISYASCQQLPRDIVQFTCTVNKLRYSFGMSPHCSTRFSSCVYFRPRPKPDHSNIVSSTSIHLKCRKQHKRHIQCNMSAVGLSSGYLVASSWFAAGGCKDMLYLFLSVVHFSMVSLPARRVWQLGQWP